MTERYSVAAERHHRVAVRLEADGETDDAAYHYGLVGENALKYGLFKSGVAQAWDSGGIKRTNTPMGKHFPKLTPIIRDLIADIRLFASGRIGAQIQSVVDDPAFSGRADWMVPPEPVPQGGPPRLVFSSLKGGVGRSTALAVLAADLAHHGLKALAIDLDLEAPGIGFMLLEASEDPAQDRRPNYGVLDYLVENGLGGVADEDLFDFVGVSPLTDGSVDVVPVVGRVTDQYPETMLAKLSRAHGEDAGSHGPISFTHQVREMVDRFAARAQYDVILIDARAGLAESSAPALLALGAEILFFGADQPQTFLSYRYLFAHLLHCFGTGPGGYRDWRGHLSFVQAKAPSSAQQRIDFRDRLHGLCAEFLYDKESLAADGSVQVADFNSGADGGRLEPHQ